MLERESNTARRLSDLCAATPADATLQNLLQTLAQKLETCGRLPVLEYEAHTEGHEDCAATFSTLAEVERSSVEELLACLRRHLDATRPVAAAARPSLADERGR